MRLLVTGGAGFIGSTVVRQALWHGHQVLNIDAMTYAASLETLRAVEKNPNYCFAHVNICDRSALDVAFEGFQPDAVVHLAAESHVDRSIAVPEAFLETNVRGTFNMLEAAHSFWLEQGRPAGFRFVHTSTDEVFGSLGPQGRFTETSAYAPNSPYSATKASSDHLVRAWHRTYGLPTVICNGSNTYGPYQFPEKLVPVIILNALVGQRVPIYGCGENRRDWMFVEDHAAALLLLARRGRAGRRYIIGSDCERSNMALAAHICAILDEMCPKTAPHARLLTHVADRPGHDARYAVDATRLRQEAGWRPETALDDGLRQTVRWYLDNRAWWAPLRTDESDTPRLGTDA